MPKFYLCPEEGCNRKYKRKDKLENHLLETHKRIIDNIGESIEITKENKKKIESERNEQCKKLNLEEIRIEIERTKQLELDCRKRAEDEMMESYRKIEEEKLKLEVKWVDILDRISKRDIVNDTDCCICFERPADSAPSPCGHKNFCLECISDYHVSFPNRGCPVCRREILMVNRIY